MLEQEKKSTFDLYAELAEMLFAIPDIEDPQRAQRYSQLSDDMTHLWLLMTDEEEERARELVGKYTERRDILMGEDFVPHEAKLEAFGDMEEEISMLEMAVSRGHDKREDLKRLQELLSIPEPSLAGPPDSPGGYDTPKESCLKSCDLLKGFGELKTRLQILEGQVQRLARQDGKPASYGPIKPLLPVKNPNSKPGSQPKTCKCGSYRKP